MEISDKDNGSDAPSPSSRKGSTTPSAPNSASSHPQSVKPESSTPDAQPGPSAQEIIKLSPEQQQVLNMVKTGNSVFFTGSAGTGKSVLLRQIIQWCEEDAIEYAVIASTGIAAINIGGCTLHSWAGIGLGKEEADKLVGKILGQEKHARQKEKQQREVRGLSPLPEDYDSSDESNSRVLKRWRKCRVLIIDESTICPGVAFWRRSSHNRFPSFHGRWKIIRQIGTLFDI